MLRPLSALLLIATSLAAQAPRAALETLTGTYASPAPEPWYGGHGTRRFTFEKGQWSLVFTHALDAHMQRPTFGFRTHGPYRIGADSAAVPGAFEGVFYEDAKLVTLLTELLTATLYDPAAAAPTTGMERVPAVAPGRFTPSFCHW